MFGRRSKLLETIERLTGAVESLSEPYQTPPFDPTGGALEARVQECERKINDLLTKLATITAEAEAMTIRAESVFKAARNAEERTRHRERTLSSAEDGDEELTREQLRILLEDGVQPNDAGGGEEVSLPTMSRDLAVDPGDAEEAELRRRQWGH